MRKASSSKDENVRIAAASECILAFENRFRLGITPRALFSANHFVFLPLVSCFEQLNNLRAKHRCKPYLSVDLLKKA